MLKQQNWLKMRRFQNAVRKLWSSSANTENLRDPSTPRLLNDRQSLQHPRANLLYKGSFSALVVAGLALAAACTYKSPATETPVPSETETSKSFFITTKVDPKTGQTINVPKTFLCGWASEMETGWAAQTAYTNNVMVPEHCNIVFEITESKLLGKLINPSFPNDPTRWEVVLTIPIKSHYYTETEKDGAGRDTNRVIRNTSRSHWSARPNMDLDLDSINFQTRWASYDFWGSNTNIGTMNVEKVEWDTKSGFLAFTVNRGTYGSSYSRIRFNFQAFETNPDFKSTPFNDKNYKRMNVLHIIGEKVNGLYPILQAAHWDLTKKHEIRLWQFPEAYKEIVKEVVSDWNEALRKAEATTLSDGPFVVSDTPAEHAFDLRYPTIAWVADEKISSYSALGVGMALADVKNGEIKWGMITLYGGMIESYMKSYLPTSTDSGMAGKIAGQILSRLGLPTSLDLPPAFRNLVGKMGLPRSEGERLAMDLVKARIDKSKKEPSDTEMKAEAERLQNTLQDIFNKGVQLSQSKLATAKLQTSTKNFGAMMRKNLFPANDQADNEISDSDSDPGSQKRVAKANTSRARENELIQKFSGPMFCQGRTFADVATGWAKAISANADKTGSKDGVAKDRQILRNIIKELTSHEYGHFLGLGHQFKENILPAKGSVPDSIYNSLVENAREENGYTNYTSVMGYRNPEVEIAQKEGVKPGPQDILVLRFLYRQEYATYKTGDADFTFANLPANGIIPDANPEKPEYKTSYFPQCNDVEATLALDPYCNRFDKGSNANVIMKSYFSDLTSSLHTLFAFTDARGGCPECVEGYLWFKSFRTLGRTRVFYDYMRLYFKKEIDRIRSDEDALMEFSSACQREKIEQINNPTLKQIFTEKPQLKELCQANALAMREMKGLVSLDLTDFTQKDVSGKFLPGGMDGGDAERDWSRWSGSWTEMTGLPVKTATLYALTTGVPWSTDMGMMANPLYDDPNYRFSYSYLYPREYTEIVAANVRNNLRFASLGQSDRTTMGRSVLTMGWMSDSAWYGNNDASLFPPQYVEKIRNQQQFSLGLVAILLKGRNKDDNPNFVDGWEGSVYDPNTDKSSPLTNAYIMPGGTVIASSPGMFLYPITKFTPYSDKEGYLFAYKLEYSRDTTDSLSEFSVKTDLRELHERLINACVMGTDGANNGLAHFFTSTVPEFKGFQMGEGLARNEETRKLFLESIDKAFAAYYASNKSAKPETCRESIRGLGLIISSAAILNGYWLPEVMDYIQK